MKLHVVGVSHTIASVKTREALVLTPRETAAWLDRQRAYGRSAAILSTCNRFEIYWSEGDDLEPWFREFARERGIELGPMLVRLDGPAAVRHLFCVASGLDSGILGETEILGQVRRAHHATRAAGASSREFDAVFQGAIEAGRRVRPETVALAQAHRIVDEELERLKTSLRARAAAPQLAELHTLALEICRLDSSIGASWYGAKVHPAP